MNSAATYQGTVVVIPTRNRAGLAANAARSVLSRPDAGMRVLVSDNSTSEQEASELARLCGEIGDSRLRLVRPPEPLAMSAHWNWAMRQALEYDASHFTFLTDRMLF
ncbi:MAG TPA: glycosyltransferase, partial [Pyrinomonadaceae bacterium]|nr:glycosyltransferase [Pyrinomonadaceae bacterium]